MRVGGGPGLAQGVERLGARRSGGHLARPRAQRLLGGVPVAARVQGAGQRERGAPLRGGQVAVAAGQRQPVRLAHGGHADDVHAEVQVAHHAADQGELLGVLLPVERHVGPGEVEQLGDDGEHAVEVPGPDGTLETAAHGAGAQPHLGLAAGVDLLGGGREHEVRAGRLGDRQVGLQGARVAVEVLARTELQRVDEDGDHDESLGADACAGRPDERGVTLVEGAHGHHDAGGAAGDRALGT